MAKTREVFKCVECGADHPKWAGRCSSCGEWNTLVEELKSPVGAALPNASTRAIPIADVDARPYAAVPTMISELDRVLSGGFVPGSVTLIGGEPGVGKSTLLLQAASEIARNGGRVLYASAEESEQQVRSRAERLGGVVDGLWLGSETSLPHLIAQIEQVEPTFVVVDSIQTIFDPESSSAPGSVAQVRDCTHKLVRQAKARSIAIVLVGHVTKEGSIAGPRVLEHLVDTVISFEGDRHHSLRLLRAAKHRFGSVQEIGLFEMSEAGLIGVPDASALFLADRCKGVAGSVVVPTIEGRRPVLVELQALAAPSNLGSPRRSAQGIDSGRLSLLLAVLERRVRFAVGQADVYALAVGGAKVVEPAADLGVALAVASSLANRPVPSDIVVCGEVGLGGELRQIGQLDRRLSEAARLGFERALVPASSPDVDAPIKMIRAASLAEAIERLDMAPGTER